MAIALRSVLRGQQSALALKAIAFAGFLLAAKAGAFGIVPTALFLGVVVFLYARPSYGSARFLGSMLSLTLLSVGLLVVLAEGAAEGMVYVSAAFLFYVIVGLKVRFFTYRNAWHYLLSLSLSYCAAILFFGGATSLSVSVKILGAGIVFFLVWREFFLTHAESARALSSGEAPLTSAVSPNLSASIVSLLATESVWALSFLPLLPVALANLALIVLFTVTEFLRLWLRSALTPRIILTRISFASIFSILIFFVTEWSL